MDAVVHDEHMMMMNVVVVQTFPDQNFECLWLLLCCIDIVWTYCLLCHAVYVLLLDFIVINCLMMMTDVENPVLSRLPMIYVLFCLLVDVA